MIREKITFENYQENDYNELWDVWNVNGVKVYEDGHLIGNIAWKSEEEISNMTDEEVEEMLVENAIITNH
jgi:hypothetical protein